MNRLLAVSSLVTALVACGGSTATKPEPKVSTRVQSVEIQSDKSAVAPAPKPAEPQLPAPEPDWFKKDNPCPDGSTLVGAEPPNGMSLACMRAERNHGSYVGFYADGKVNQLGLYRNGDRFGQWISYYPSGTIQSRSSWDERGRMVGEELYYHESGKLASRTVYDDDGTPTGSATSWYENGRKSSETQFENGQINGTVSSWRDNGVPMYTGEYVDGVAEGAQTMYHDNGEKAFERMYSKDRLNGTCRQWSPQGKLLGSFEMNQGSGTFIEWWDNGQKRYSAQYKQGLHEGSYTEWHDNGRVATKGLYKQSSPVGEWLSYADNGALSDKITYQPNGGYIDVSYANGKKKTYLEYTTTYERIEGQFENDKRHGDWKQFDQHGDLRTTETYVRGKLKKTTKHERPELPEVDQLMTGLDVCDAYIRRAMTCPQVDYYEKRSLVEMVEWWKSSLKQGDEGKARVSETCRNYAEYSSGCNGKS